MVDRTTYFREIFICIFNDICICIFPEKKWPLSKKSLVYSHPRSLEKVVLAAFKLTVMLCS